MRLDNDRSTNGRNRGSESQLSLISSRVPFVPENYSSAYRRYDATAAEKK